MISKVMAGVGAGLLATTLFAAAQDYVGTWKGAVHYEAQGDDPQDGNVEVQIAIDDAGKLSFHESFYDWSFEFDTVGEAVSLSGAPVGTLNDQGLAVSFKDPSDATCMQSYTLAPTGEYLDDYKCDDGFFAKVTGTLQKSAPVKALFLPRNANKR